MSFLNSISDLTARSSNKKTIEKTTIKAALPLKSNQIFIHDKITRGPPKLPVVLKVHNIRRLQKIQRDKNQKKHKQTEIIHVQYIHCVHVQKYKSELTKIVLKMQFKSGPLQIVVSHPLLCRFRRCVAGIFSSYSYFT